MTLDKDKIIAELVNKGLDGDMDAVNAYDDKIIRAKAKAMIIKVKKGTLERPPQLNAAPETPVSSDVPIKYALEMNRGWFRKNIINVGDTLKFINI